MAEWQERVQSMIMGFVFAYMVVKLFGVIANFRAGNMRVERASDVEPNSLAPTSEAEAEAEVETETDPEPRSSSSSSDEEEEGEDVPLVESKVESKHAEEEVKNEEGVSTLKTESEEETGGAFEEQTGGGSEEETGGGSEEETGGGLEEETGGGLEEKTGGVFQEQTGGGLEEETGGGLEEETGGGFKEETGGAFEEETGNALEKEEVEDELEDWEGVESTELEKLFGAASTFADTRMVKFNPSSEATLQLHALYKVATEGPCSSSQPSAFQPFARAKWNAWQKLGSMSQEEAMQKYIAVVTQINPNWYQDYRKSKDSAKGATQQK